MQIIDINLPTHIAFDEVLLRAHLVDHFNLQDSSKLHYKLVKRSLDARKKTLRSKLRIAIYESSEEELSFRSKELKI